MEPSHQTRPEPTKSPLPHLNLSLTSTCPCGLEPSRSIASISIAPTLPSASAGRCVVRLSNSLGDSSQSLLTSFGRRQSRLVAMQASPAPAIEARNLYFSLLNKQGTLVPILKNCSIRVPPGQLWMLLGPNGCGKSTLLKVLAGFLRPDDGIVSVKKPNSFVFQNPDHQVIMPTVEADIAFGLGKFNLTSDEVRSRVSNALEAVGLQSYSQRPIQTLSGGQKQRVAIAGALAEACKVLLLDELTTFLDEHDQVGVVEAVKNSVSSPEVAALWVTHRLEELKYADGASYMEDGKIVMHGDAPTVSNFIKEKQARYRQYLNI